MSAQAPKQSPYEVIDYGMLVGTPCPCGLARRGLMDVPSVPYSLHVTEIHADAKTHYHKTLTETYYVLESEADAYIELNGEPMRVHPNMAVVIHPLTRHRAVGKMRVLIVVTPKFDPADEWFDEPAH